VPAIPGVPPAPAANFGRGAPLFSAPGTPPFSQPAAPQSARAPSYGGAPQVGAAQAGGPSEFTRVLGAARAPSAPAPVPGGPAPKPAPGTPGRKSLVPLILAGVVLLIVLATIIVLVLVTRK
jgi:hypothetical protein